MSKYVPGQFRLLQAASEVRRQDIVESKVITRGRKGGPVKRPRDGRPLGGEEEMQEKNASSQCKSENVEG
jgi:hypothetical protein